MSIEPRLIKAYRALLGWSQEDLAERIGVGRAAIVRLENGKTGTRRSTLRAVVQAFEKEGLNLLPVATIVDVRLLRAARALLRMSRADMGKEAGLGDNTVYRLETQWSGNLSSAFAVQKALEKKGIEFIPESTEKGQGIRLRNRGTLALEKEGFDPPLATTFGDVRLLRAARVLLGLSQADLAKEAGLGRNTVARMEADAAGGHSVFSAVLKFLEQEGIEFIPACGTKGQGLRLRHKQPRSTDD